MTVIAFDGRTVAADKKSTSYGHSRTVNKLNVIDRDTVVVGCGSADRIMHVVEWFKRGADPAFFPDYKGLPDNDVPELWVFRKGQKVGKYEHTPFLIEFEDTCVAGGSGRDAAMGAMLAGAGAIRAVVIASEVCSDCGHGVDFHTFD